MERLIINGMFIVILFSLFSCAINSGNKYQDKGIEYASEGKFTQAREELKRALKLEIDPSPYPSNNALILKTIESVIDLEVEKDAAIHYFRGLGFGNRKMLDKAISEYTMAIEIDPKFAKAFNERARKHQEKGEIDKALDDYTRAVEIDPEFIYAYHNRGIAFEEKGQHDNAIADYTRAIEIAPELATAYYNRALALGRKEQYKMAIADYTKAIEFFPRYASAYHNRGFIYKTYLEETTKACKDFKMACELGRCRNYNFAKSKGDCK